MFWAPLPAGGIAQISGPVEESWLPFQQRGRGSLSEGRLEQWQGVSGLAVDGRVAQCMPQPCLLWRCTRVDTKDTRGTSLGAHLSSNGEGVPSLDTGAAPGVGFAARAARFRATFPCKLAGNSVEVPCPLGLLQALVTLKPGWAEAEQAASRTSWGCITLSLSMPSLPVSSWPDRPRGPALSRVPCG